MRYPRSFTVTLSLLIASLAVALAVATSHAQDEPAQPEQQPAIDWQTGPTTGNLGNIAEVKLGEQYLFTDKKGAQKLLELTHNIPNGNEVGAIVPAGEGEENDWFLIFEFHEIGYIKDAAKEELDADALLESMQEGTEAQNEERKKQGWSAFHVTGWDKKPFYDPKTNNLTWSIRGHSDGGGDSINYSTRILGRRGTMNIDLVVEPEDAALAVPQVEAILADFSYTQGSRYADFVSGDKVAEYGLTALVAGGTGALLMKSGLLQKFWKLIVLAFVGLAGVIKKIWARISGQKDETTTTGTTPGADPIG